MSFRPDRSWKARHWLVKISMRELKLWDARQRRLARERLRAFEGEPL